MRGLAPGRLRLTLPVVAALGLGAVLLAAACGGGGADGGDGGPTADNGSDGLNLSLRDEMRDDALVSSFVPDEFTVAAGEKVAFSLSNDGSVPHTVRLAGSDGEYNTDDDTVSDPPMIMAGEAATLVWTAPTAPGTYVFRCDYHPESIGTITVE